jgi:hypothetical protein
LAKEVASVEEIKLLDGTEVTLRPCSIKVLKKFMKVFKKMEQLEEVDQEQIMDILVEASAVALQKQLPDVTKFVDDEDESREEYEEMVDMDIVNKVNEVCGGIKFDDPNLLAAAREQAGTT